MVSRHFPVVKIAGSSPVVVALIIFSFLFFLRAYSFYFFF